MLYHGLQVLARLGELLPSAWAVVLGRLLGDLWFHVVPIRRRLVMEQLARAFERPLNDPWVRRTAARNFRHYGLTLLEILRVGRWRRPADRARIRYQGVSHLADGLRGFRGGLVVTAHLGGFVPMLAAGAWDGLRMGIVIKRLALSGVERFWAKALGTGGVEVLFNREAIGDVLRLLRRGRILAFMLDQHDSRHGDRVVFFGRPAWTFRALAVLAQRRQQPVVPAFCWREPDGLGYRVAMGPTIPPPGPGEAAASALVQAMTTAIETAIRHRPEQWLWLHRRWK